MASEYWGKLFKSQHSPKTAGSRRVHRLACRRLVVLWMVRGDDTEMICDYNQRFRDSPLDCSMWRGKVPTISKVGALGNAYFVFGTLNTLVVVHAVPLHLVLGKDVERRSPAAYAPVLRCLAVLSAITLPGLAWVGVTTAPIHDAISLVFGVAIIGHTLLVWSLQHPTALERLRRSVCSSAECRLAVRSMRAAQPIEQCKAAIVGAYLALGVALLLAAAAASQQPYPNTFVTQTGPVGEWIAALLTALAQMMHVFEVSGMSSRRPNPSSFRLQNDVDMQ